MRTSDPRALASAYAEVGDEVSLAVRCSELHTYHVGGCLMERDHKDSGSIITMSVCLTDPATFDGGRLLTWDGDTPIVHEAQRGDGILFRSEDLHNVSPVTKGTRHALVIELWPGARNTIDRNA